MERYNRVTEMGRSSSFDLGFRVFRSAGSVDGLPADEMRRALPFAEGIVPRRPHVCYT